MIDYQQPQLPLERPYHTGEGWVRLPGAAPRISGQAVRRDLAKVENAGSIPAWCS